MIFKVICIAFLIALFANMAAWSFGVNSVARYAAEHGNMPKVFASMISDDDMPNGANLVNAIVASWCCACSWFPSTPSPTVSSGCSSVPPLSSCC